MSLLVVFILAIGLSMDAFSLSLIYGTLRLDNKMHRLVSIMVGVFHFFMPVLGYQVGEVLLTLIRVNPDIIVGIIFIILGIEMILSIKKEEKIKLLTNFLSVMFFSLTVSIDSLSVGIGLGVTNTNLLLTCMIFAFISAFFTYLGIYLGKRLNNTFGNISTLIGAIILIILGITYLT